MEKVRFYVVTHLDGYSVQTRPEGAGILLATGKQQLTLSEAQLACDSANDALRLAGMLLDN